MPAVEANDKVTARQKAEAGRLMHRLHANHMYLGLVPKKVAQCKSGTEMEILLKELRQTARTLDLKPGSETLCRRWYRDG